MTLLRYETSHEVLSNQDPLADVVDWLGFLMSRDYLTELLVQTHGLSRSVALARAALITPHVRSACEYIRQSLDGPPAISFLPAYYALLNLMKVYVLLGPRHSDLPGHRWHGVTYDVLRNRQSILTDEVTIKKGGVMPLFYETLTGVPFGARQRTVQMRDLLPFVMGVTHEYELATGKPSRLVVLGLSFVQRSGGTYPLFRPSVQEDGVPLPWRRTDLKLLRKFRVDATEPNAFIGPRVVHEEKQLEETRAHLRTHLIYRAHPDVLVTPLSSGRFELPEELPIALLFFYMSSVVRYRPEFFARLQDSRLWPFLASARVHAFYSFLLAFWSFMQRKNYFVFAQGRF